MLKKSGALFLSVLYTVTVYGFALNFHYCGRLLTAVNIDAASSLKGCNMLVEGKMKCCKDKLIKIKVKDVHQSTSTGFSLASFVFTLPTRLFGDHFFSAQQILAEKRLGRAPPAYYDTGDVPVFLKNCTFRI